MYDESPRVTEKEKGAETFFKELVTENFPNMGWRMNIQIHEAQRILNRLNIKYSSLSHIITKLLKLNDKENFVSNKSDLIIYQGTLIRLSADF